MKTGEYSAFDLLLSAREAERAICAAKPCCQPLGRVVLGTVEGDLDSVSKDMVKMLLEASGFEVVDLGIDVSPRQFVNAALENQVDIIAMFTLMATTMPVMGQVMEELKEVGYRQQVKVLVGGAPVTPGFAEQIGADGYGSTAASVAQLIQSWAGCCC